MLRCNRPSEQAAASGRSPSEFALAHILPETGDVQTREHSLAGVHGYSAKTTGFQCASKSKDLSSGMDRARFAEMWHHQGKNGEVIIG